MVGGRVRLSSWLLGRMCRVIADLLPIGAFVLARWRTQVRSFSMQGFGWGRVAHEIFK